VKIELAPATATPRPALALTHKKSLRSINLLPTQ
jgi:hypothetical protein